MEKGWCFNDELKKANFKEALKSGGNEFLESYKDHYLFLIEGLKARVKSIDMVLRSREEYQEAREMYRKAKRMQNNPPLKKDEYEHTFKTPAVKRKLYFDEPKLQVNPDKLPKKMAHGQWELGIKTKEKICKIKEANKAAANSKLHFGEDNDDKTQQ